MGISQLGLQSEAMSQKRKSLINKSVSQIPCIALGDNVENDPTPKGTKLTLLVPDGMQGVKWAVGNAGIWKYHL